MELQPLGPLAHSVRIGEPLAFSIYDAEGRLLLSSGHALESAQQLRALLERGAHVEIDPLVELARSAGREQLYGLWSQGERQLNAAFQQAQGKAFCTALERAAQPMLALLDRDPDLAIFRIVRGEADPSVSGYATRHAVHAASAAYLAARRLGWPAAQAELALRAGLTMNIGMLSLQNQLATQATPLTRLQREAVRSHPMRSADMLRSAGVQDAQWLAAVEQHHEAEDGSGYPTGMRDVCELAGLLRRADIFTAKFSRRGARQAMRADGAARQMFQSDKTHRVTAALVKEFGLYPPGCVVKLASGATAVVVRRSPSATAPWVACVTDAAGQPLAQPVWCDSSEPAHAVVAVQPSAGLKFDLAQLVVPPAG